MENGPFEDVFIKNGDIPASYVSFREGTPFPENSTAASPEIFIPNWKGFPASSFQGSTLPEI